MIHKTIPSYYSTCLQWAVERPFRFLALPRYQVCYSYGNNSKSLTTWSIPLSSDSSSIPSCDRRNKTSPLRLGRPAENSAFLKACPTGMPIPQLHENESENPLETSSP